VAATTTNLFVGNLPFKFGDRDLRDLFAPFGEVTRAVVGINRDTGMSKVGKEEKEEGGKRKLSCCCRDLGLLPMSTANQQKMLWRL
jgi:hypothetical protein